MIASPCVKVCIMDEDDRYCRGCRRTLGEIARWTQMTDAERAAVIGELSARQPRGGTLAPQPAP